MRLLNGWEPQNFIKKGMRKMSTTIRVYVRNLGKYNEGKDVGGWLDLPQPQTEIDKFLHDVAEIDIDPAEKKNKLAANKRVYEEYAIHDYEFPQSLYGFTPTISEWTPLRVVNALACLLDQVDVEALEVVEAFQTYIEPLDAIEQASMLAHIMDGDEAEGVWSYDTEGFNNNDEAYGYYCVNELNYELAHLLDSQNIECYFNYEVYGRDQAQDGYLCDGIYIDSRSNLYGWSEDYGISEIQEILAEDYGEEFFESLGDKKLWAEREALGKEHGFELEKDEDDYLYYREFQPKKGQKINTIVEFDPDKNQWKTYTVDFNYCPAQQSQGYFFPEVSKAFAMGNTLYADIKKSQEGVVNG